MLTGECQCHFHQVVPVAADEDTDDVIGSQKPPVNRYNVQGPINAALTDVLVHYLCPD